MFQFRKITAIFILISLIFSNLFHVHLSYGQEIGAGRKSLKQGISAYEEGKYEEAIGILKLATHQFPSDDREGFWEAYFYIGLSYHILGRSDEAMNMFRSAYAVSRNKIPDPEIHSSEILKLYQMAQMPIETSVPPPPPPKTTFCLNEAGEKRFYCKWWFATIVVGIIGGAITASSGGNGGDNNDSSGTGTVTIPSP